MKKITAILLLITWAAANVLAQDPDVDPEPGSALAQRIHSMKVAFITDRLRLTPEESQQFWPLFNQYEAEEGAIRKSYRPARPIQSMSDQEAEEFIMKNLEMEEKLIDLKRDYFKKFRQVISPRKIAMLQKADQEFKRELLKRLQERRANR